MIIKPHEVNNYPINSFFLLGFDETGLSKAFSYCLSKNELFFKHFLKYIGVTQKIDKSFFNNCGIEIEKVRDEGRTDIEIYCPTLLHIIIECKVRNNTINEQRTQYLDSFKHEVVEKILCFITDINDYRFQFNENIKIKNLNWNDIDILLDNRKFENNETIVNFQNYLRKGYKLNNRKEILVQDLSVDIEIEKFEKYNLYRRQKIFGSPLYFSPYYSKTTKNGEGIKTLSRICGIISAKPNEISSFIDDLNLFSGGNKDLVNKWLTGLKLDTDDTVYTYFFLDDPLFLNTSLLKETTKKKGQGKDWIAAMIPRNRCVSFLEFMKRLNDKIEIEK